MDSVPPAAAPSSGIVGALMEVMQKRSKAIHSSGTDSFADLLFRSETSAGDLRNSSSLPQMRMTTTTKMKTLRTKTNGMISLFFFFLTPSPSSQPRNGSDTTAFGKKETLISNISVNVPSSLYIFVAFVLFINLCNTSFNLQRSVSYSRSSVMSAVCLCLALYALRHPVIHFRSHAAPPQTDRCRLCLKELYFCVND